MNKEYSFKTEKELEFFKNAYEKGRLLALWRLKDFFILYKEVVCMPFEPSAVRLIDETLKNNSQRKSDEKEAKLNATFLIGFSALEALVNCVGIILARYFIENDKSPSELDIATLMDDKSRVGKGKLLSLDGKFSKYPSLLAEIVRCEQYEFNKGCAEWSALKEIIKIRNSLTHAKVEIGEDGEISSHVFAPQIALKSIIAVKVPGQK